MLTYARDTLDTLAAFVTF